MSDLGWTIVTAIAGAVAGLGAASLALVRPPEWSLRTNVSGRQVPALLGYGIFAGGMVGIAAVLSGTIFGPRHSGGEVETAAFVVFLALAWAGLMDDLRGDEGPRGFGGHLRARRLTGGLVKILLGGFAGYVAGMLVVYPGDRAMGILTALAVPLAANLFNLLDRAPGRAGKYLLLAALPLFALGHEDWRVAAAGAFGALVALLPLDLREKGMLGDAGANPLGALVGLGLAVSLDRVALTVAVGVLLALNAASEVWSFSKVIDRTPPLRAFDRIGRK